MAEPQDTENETPEPSGAPEPVEKTDPATPLAPVVDPKDPYASLRGRDLTSDEASALIEKLQSANGEAASYRHKIKDLELAQETAQDKAVREATELASKDVDKKWEPIIKGNAIVLALTAAKAASPQSLVRLVDLDKLTVNEDGTVDGIDEEVVRIKTDFAALFADDEDSALKRRSPAARADGGNKAGRTATKSSAQRHAERILGA